MTERCPRRKRTIQARSGGRPRELAEPKSTSALTGSSRACLARWKRTRHAGEQNRAGRLVAAEAEARRHEAQLTRRIEAREVAIAANNDLARRREAYVAQAEVWSLELDEMSQARAAAIAHMSPAQVAEADGARQAQVREALAQQRDARQRAALVRGPRHRGPELGYGHSPGRGIEM
ncbi:MAG: hypothetical protein ACRDX8_03325 [Acidimicrobiales bacterium]